MTPTEIKQFRTGRGLSQQQLADLIGVDQATVSRIENGAPPAKPVEILLDRLVSDARSEKAA